MEELMAWMRSVRETPRPLKVLCRNAIRKMLRRRSRDTDIVGMFRHLPVPPIIQRYLAFFYEFSS
jgi:hypothetical protein